MQPLSVVTSVSGSHTLRSVGAPGQESEPPVRVVGRRRVGWLGSVIVGVAPGGARARGGAGPHAPSLSSDCRQVKSR